MVSDSAWTMKWLARKNYCESRGKFVSTAKDKGRETYQPEYCHEVFVR